MSAMREIDMREIEFDPETFPEPRPIGPNVMRRGEPGATRAAYPKGYPRERIARAALRIARRLGLRR